MSKPYLFRDGPLVDGIAQKVEYEVAETLDVPTNISDLNNDEGFLTLSSLPPDFNNQILSSIDVDGVTTGISISDGNTITINHPTSTTGGGSQTRVISSSIIDDQNINVDAVVDITPQLTQGNWVVNNEQRTYIGTPDIVTINAMTSQSILQNANTQRPAPLLNVEKLIEGVFVQVATSATGYIRDTTDHEQSSHTIFYRDVNPGTNPTYRLSSGAESSNNSVVTTFKGQFDLEAVTN